MAAKVSRTGKWLPWSALEDEMVASRWSVDGKHIIAEQLGRTPNAVHTRARFLGVNQVTRPHIGDINFEALQELVVRPGIEKKLIPLLAYRGVPRIGIIHRKWNLVIAMMLADAVTFGDGAHIWLQENQSKLCGPEAMPQNMLTFFAKLRDNPKVTDNIPNLTEYVEHLHPWPCTLTRVSPTTSRRGAASWRIYKASELREITIKPYETHYPFLIHDIKRPDWGRDLTAKINAIVPRSLPPDVRADVSQDLILNVLEGTLLLADLETNVRGAVRKVFQMHPTKYGPLSLDQVLPGTDGLRLMDIIPDEASLDY